MTKLALLAHAATAATRTAAFAADESLDPQGFAAAGAITVRRHDDAVRAPAAACRDTAAAFGLAARIDVGLSDCDYGRWAGRSLDEVAAHEPLAIQDWLGDPDAAPHGGESLTRFLTRTRTWLRELPSHPRTLLAITHPAVIRALIVATLDAPAAAFWRIDIPPLTETVLIGGADRWSLRSTGAPPAGPRSTDSPM